MYEAYILRGVFLYAAFKYYFQEFKRYSRPRDLLLFYLVQRKGQHWHNFAMADRTF